MNLLILGGTKFLGRHLVDAALSREHRLTLFNRGTTNPHLFPGVEKLFGDRNRNLNALRNRQWDAVIDTCGYVSEQVRATGELLANAVKHYTFFSSISVYRDFIKNHQDESFPVAVLPKGASENENDSGTYGARKALCERAAEQTMPGRVLNIRPGIIVGPYDSSGRFTYWVHRVAQNGDVLCPAPANAPLQLIDVRDLAQWVIRMVETKTTGTYNAAAGSTFQQMLQECKIASGSHARFIWVDERFLLDRQVDLPFWIPEGEKRYTGFFTINCERALKAGLTFRSLTETARDVLLMERDSSNCLQNQNKIGPAANREIELLQMWQERVQA